MAPNTYTQEIILQHTNSPVGKSLVKSAGIFPQSYVGLLNTHTRTHVIQNTPLPTLKLHLVLASLSPKSKLGTLMLSRCVSDRLLLAKDEPTVLALGVFTILML